MSACGSHYHGSLPPEFSEIESRLAAVEQRITAALKRSGRARSEITLVAVSKKFSATAIQSAYEAGLRNFGENYVQEFQEKWEKLQPLTGACFHLIGHLQSNKAKVACELFNIVQTVDSPKLLQRLDAAAALLNRTMEVLLEVKLSDEESKSGANTTEIPQLLDTAANCSRLRVTGLMTVPPWSENPEAARPYFQKLAKLAGDYKLSQLSMGMSNDFETAIEEGATIIRVGTAIFGKRPPINKHLLSP